MLFFVKEQSYLLQMKRHIIVFAAAVLMAFSAAAQADTLTIEQIRTALRDNPAMAGLAARLLLPKVTSRW